MAVNKNYFVLLQENADAAFFASSSVADSDPGSGIGCFLTPGSGIRDPE
jgi:hypothetical protein